MPVETIVVQIRQLETARDLPLPAYQSKHAVAVDLHLAVGEPLTIQPRDIVSVPCGFAVAIPDGYEAQVRPRSGLASEHGIAVINSPGTIDSDYRGEVKVLLINLGSKAFVVGRGMRIAQMLVLPVPRIEWQSVDELPATLRSTGGFGHTGQ